MQNSLEYEQEKLKTKLEKCPNTEKAEPETATVKPQESAPITPPTPPPRTSGGKSRRRSSRKSSKRSSRRRSRKSRRRSRK